MFVFLNHRKNVLRTQKLVRNIYGKQAIRVRALRLHCIMHMLFDVCNVCVFVDKKGLKEDWPLANWSTRSK